MAEELDLSLELCDNISLQDILLSFQRRERTELDIRADAYMRGNFYPICIGQIYEQRYLVLRKLGYGMYSTVWLVVDIHTDQYWAMKVLSAECYGRGPLYDTFELQILERFRETQGLHPGSRYVSQLHDHFGVKGPNGYSMFLIFSVMGETLKEFVNCDFFDSANLPGNVVKRFVKQILLALDYAHKNGVIHTDIKLDNIMIQLPDERTAIRKYLIRTASEDEEVPEEGAQEPEPDSQAPARRSSDCELTFLTWPNSEVSDELDNEQIKQYCWRKFDIDPEWRKYNTWDIVADSLKYDYLPDEVTEDDILNLDVSLGDWGVASWEDKHLCELISPLSLRSPEVMLRAPWDCKTDIWSLGASLVELLGDYQLFDAYGDEEGNYSELQHFHEMNLLFGRFPRSFLNRSKDQWRIAGTFDNEGYVWSPPRPNVSNPKEFWSLSWANLVDDDDREKFASFLKNMMKIDPAERMSAEQLLREPWLEGVVL